jgi:replicative DNA helicase
MGSLNKDNLGFLGSEYQSMLMNQLLTNKIFTRSIVDILDPNMFDDPTHKIIANEIVDAYENRDAIIGAEIIKPRLAEKSNSEATQKKNLAYIDHILTTKCSDCDFVQETAMRFFKQQNLKKALSKIQEIINKGGLDDYPECESIIKKALEVGDNKEDSVSATSNPENVLREDYRDPIPTGINGLDEVMNGGLAPKELGIILAPTGIGKTTLMTKIASSAKAMGKNVLQIFFEDTVEQVQRKHFSCWTQIPMQELSLPENKDFVLQKVAEEEGKPGVIRLKSMRSDITTIPVIRKLIKQLISQGFTPDMILLDYIDVVQPSKKYTDNNVAEGATMREFESLLKEFEIPGWTAIQGNRSSMSSEYVEMDQSGGSIKRTQIGHFVMSVAKSMEQRELNKANVAILKSRLGKDGFTFEDVYFNNGTVEINFEEGSGKTFLQTKNEKEVQLKKDLHDILRKKDEEKGRDGGN